MDSMVVMDSTNLSLSLRQVIAEHGNYNLLMVRNEIGGNHFSDEDRIIRAITTGVVTAAIDEICP